MIKGVCISCNIDVSKNSHRCKSCSNVQRKGFKMSMQAKANISKSLKGRITWNKGLTKYTNKSLAVQAIKIRNDKQRGVKISQSKMGRKRKPFSKQWRENLSKANIKNGTFKGKNNPGWKGGIMKDKPVYISRYHGLRPFEWNLLRKRVIKLKGEFCLICNKICSPPCIDHIIPYRISFDNSINNLQVLCGVCHIKKDSTW